MFWSLLRACLMDVVKFSWYHIVMFLVRFEVLKVATIKIASRM